MPFGNAGPHLGKPSMESAHWVKTREWTLISDPSDPYKFFFIARQHMWRLKFCNPNQYTNIIGGATRLSVSIVTLFRYYIWNTIFFCNCSSRNKTFSLTKLTTRLLMEQKSLYFYRHSRPLFHQSTLIKFSMALFKPWPSYGAIDCFANCVTTTALNCLFYPSLFRCHDGWRRRRWHVFGVGEVNVGHKWSPSTTFARYWLYQRENHRLL